MIKANYFQSITKVPKVMNRPAIRVLAVLQNEQQLIAWRDRALVDVQEKIKTVRQQSQTLERRISDLERIIKNATIIAPISGRIDETQQINIGDFVFNGEELFRIVPESATALKAEILADPSAIARIQKGQKVSLRFPSLPPSPFGQLEGIVSLIPADVKFSGTNAYILLEATIPNPYLIAQNGEKTFLSDPSRARFSTFVHPATRNEPYSMLNIYPRVCFLIYRIGSSCLPFPRYSDPILNPINACLESCPS